METTSITLAREVEALARWKDDATRTLAARSAALEHVQTLLDEAEEMGRALRTALGRIVAAKVAAEGERDRALWAQGVAEARLEIAAEMADRLARVICEEVTAHSETWQKLDTTRHFLRQHGTRADEDRVELVKAQMDLMNAEVIAAALVAVICADAEAMAELIEALDGSVDTIANMVERIFTARGERDDARRRAEEAERVIAANRTCRCARAEA